MITPIRAQQNSTSKFRGGEPARVIKKKVLTAKRWRRRLPRGPRRALRELVPDESILDTG